ncbi:hypothetical protein ACOSP7_007857 [Xanthoceras sorbifolium]
MGGDSSENQHPTFRFVTKSATSQAVNNMASSSGLGGPTLNMMSTTSTPLQSTSSTIWGFPLPNNKSSSSASAAPFRGSPRAKSAPPMFKFTCTPASSQNCQPLPVSTTSPSSSMPLFNNNNNKQTTSPFETQNSSSQPVRPPTFNNMESSGFGGSFVAFCPPFSSTSTTPLQSTPNNSAPFTTSTQPATASYSSLTSTGSMNAPALGCPAPPIFTFSCTPASPSSPLALFNNNKQTTYSFGEQTSTPTSIKGCDWGSRVTAYTQTHDPDNSVTFSNMILKSISAMPTYEHKSHEQLRWEDYQSQGDSSDKHKSTFRGFASATHSADSSRHAGIISGPRAPFKFTMASSSATTDPSPSGFASVGFGGCSFPDKAFSSNATAASFQSTNFTSQPPFNSTSAFGATTDSTTSRCASFAFHSPNNVNSSSSISNATPSPLQSSPFTSQPAFFGPPSSSVFGNFGGTSQATTSASITSSSTLFASTPVTSTFGCGLSLPNTKPPFAPTRPTYTFFSTPSSAPTFDFSSSPMELGERANPPLFQQTPPLFQRTSPFGGGQTLMQPPAIHVCKRCGDKSFWGQQWGSRVTSYMPSLYWDLNPFLLISVSAMPCYKDKCHEELRWEDYQMQGKPQEQVAPASEFATYGDVKPQFALPVLMLPVMPTSGSCSFNIIP